MKKLKILFLAWQDPHSRSWFPIGKLTFDGTNYQFTYTQGAEKAKKKCNFQPLLSFPEVEKVYTSTYLFPVFANRLMPKNRPDYLSFIQWLNLSHHEEDSISILARTGGHRETDTLSVFPCPEPDSEGKYRLHFFLHGLRYLPQCTIERINRLQVGEELWLAHEFHNKHDAQAITLNTQDHYIVGYCPRYLNREILALLSNSSLEKSRVEIVNQLPTPLQFRLLCNITAQCSNEFIPFSSREYQPL